MPNRDPAAPRLRTPAKSAPAGSPPSAEARRDRITQLVWPLFLEKGYDNVSIDEIISVVGGSKATLYSWFGGKRGLFEAVVRQKCGEVTLAIHCDERASLETQLIQIGRSFLETVLSQPILEFHRLMVSIGRKFPAMGRLFYETGPNTAYGLVGAWVARQQAAGLLRQDEDPFRLSVLFLDMLIGEQQLAALTGAGKAARRERIEETVAVAARIFLRGCESHDGSARTP